MIFFAPVIVKPMEKNLDITKPLYGEQILPVPWPFVISRFHYMPYIYQLRVVMQAYQSPLLHLCSICFKPMGKHFLFFRGRGRTSYYSMSLSFVIQEEIT